MGQGQSYSILQIPQEATCFDSCRRTEWGRLDLTP